ncbi:NgoMIV family type II restriction endonuclease [Streptomyces sp. NPDC016845]|uniref:NgoMIV family type II restriction endonuclease n=1 Tax=Streptomyces sp. NPDC016845 TaxID=3364972 RepID=UPI003796189F
MARFDLMSDSDCWRKMPAPFITSICGYRDGRPNTSDANDTQSKELGTTFFDAMGISRNSAPPSQAVGNYMSELMTADLANYFSAQDLDLAVEPEKAFPRFEQFLHLNVTKELGSNMAKDVVSAIADLETYAARNKIEPELSARLEEHLVRIRSEVQRAEDRRRDLLDVLGQESLLKLDVTVSRTIENKVDPSTPLQHLLAGFSLKWTLRTDRAQDCRSQGAKMAALRRGRMPHFATVTMEPRPSMLALLGRGSGDVDCVYHLHLPALTEAIDDYCSGTKRKGRLGIRDNFRRLCDQRRVRDYDELRSYTATL